MLLAYENYLREDARNEYRTRRIEYAVLAPWANKKMRPPKLPSILRGENERG